MAITRVGVMANPPTNIDDYTHILAHLDAYAKQVGNQGMILTEWTNTTTAPKIAMGSYISHGGTLFVVDTEDYVVTTAIDGYQYFRVCASGDTLIIDTVSSVVGYSWNAIYNGLYDVSGNQILPYQFNMNAGTGLYEKRKITNLMQGSGFVTVDYLGRVIMGALTCASVDTGSGPISGASVDTGQGATEVHLMNQNLRTTDSVHFANINPPVDNNDASMPSVGIGGFTFGVVTNGNITLPPGGTMMVIGFWNNGFSDTNSGRKSGGSVLNFPDGKGNVFAWRIA